MYTREQASQIRQAFWTAFGRYMAPQPSAEGLKINWINYKTGLKHVYFRMQAEKDHAAVAIEMVHPDPDLQQLFFAQFEELKTLLQLHTEADWAWALHDTDTHGKTVSSISQTLSGVNVFREDDWSAIISFLKPRIIALDAFWSEAQYAFDGLR